MTFRKTFSALAFSWVACAAAAQTDVVGMVVDSATMVALPNVNVRVNSSQRVTVTDIRGQFALKVAQNDTLIFSRVGYGTRKIPVKRFLEGPVVFLAEARTILAPVEINATNRPAWLPQLPPESPWRNRTQDQRLLNTPGLPTVQTFGPGYVLKGPFSRFSKDAREQRKRKAQANRGWVKSYVSIVNAPEVKGKIMKDFNISEETYYKLLARFNEKYKDMVDRLDEPELISLLLSFYGQETRDNNPR